jgi:hypothetical protein
MANNVTLPAQGAGSASPVVESIDIGGGTQRQVVTVGDRGGNAVDVIGSLTETAPTTDTASSGLNGRLQRVAQRLTSLIALLPSALTAAGGLRVGGTTANPSSVLTRPANTTAYAQLNLIANNVTAGSITVPSFTATPATSGTGSIRSCRLYTNKTSGWGGASFLIEFWAAAPTFTNGDHGAYAVATGAANWLGAMTVTLTQVADGAYGMGVSNVGSTIDFALSGVSTIFWSLEITSAAALTPASGQTFTLVPEIFQD